jgi:hypothetical protein
MSGEWRTGGRVGGGEISNDDPFGTKAKKYNMGLEERCGCSKGV